MLSKEEIKTLLKESTCVVKFIKSDGSIRNMTCTLNASAIPPQQVSESTSTKVRKEDSENIVRVWDIEKSAWRSFKISTVISLSTL
jgi:hypothetical protein